VDLMVVGISTITIFAPITLFALINTKAFVYRKAALVSILVAFFVNLILFTAGILYPDHFQAKSSFVPAFFLGTLVLLIGIKMTKTKEIPANKSFN
jgi:hypothetical protein